jgi:hypothetical protein
MLNFPKIYSEVFMNIFLFLINFLGNVTWLGETYIPFYLLYQPIYCLANTAP